MHLVPAMWGHMCPDCDHPSHSVHAADVTVPKHGQLTGFLTCTAHLLLMHSSYTPQQQCRRRADHYARPNPGLGPALSYTHGHQILCPMHYASKLNTSAAA